MDVGTRTSVNWSILLLLCIACIDAKAQLVDTLTVHFPFNSYQLQDRDKEALHSWLKSLHTKGIVDSILFIGHCDSIGSVAYNLKLSQQRAEAARSFVADNWRSLNFSSACIGKGKGEPLNNNSTEEMRNQNRRVEMRVKYLMEAKPAVSTQKIDTIRRSREIIPPVPLSKLTDSTLREGDSLVLPGLVFFGNRHVPMPASVPVLQQLLGALLARRTLRIEIDGYVCCTDEDKDGTDVQTNTDDLSVRRAKFVYDYLVEHGIDASRLRYKGFGGSNKLFPLEENSYQQAMNRRVSIRVLSK